MYVSFIRFFFRVLFTNEDINAYAYSCAQYISRCRPSFTDDMHFFPFIDKKETQTNEEKRKKLSKNNEAICVNFNEHKYFFHRKTHCLISCSYQELIIQVTYSLTHSDRITHYKWNA